MPIMSVCGFDDVVDEVPANWVNLNLEKLLGGKKVCSHPFSYALSVVIRKNTK